MDLSIGNQTVQDRHDDWVLGHNHGPAGLQIKPVHHVGSVIAPRQITGHVVHHRSGFSGNVGMALLSPRLIDHQQVPVFKQDSQVWGSSGPVLISRRGAHLIPVEEHVNPVTGMNRHVHRLVLTVDQDVPAPAQVVDQPVRQQPLPMEQVAQ